MRVNDRYVTLYYEMDNDLGPIKIVPKKTALLLVDLQRVFVERPKDANESKDEQAHREKWSQFYDAMEEIVIPNNKRILDVCRKKNIDIVYAKIQSRTTDGRDRSLVQRSSGFNDLLLPPGSRESEIIPEIAPKNNEIVIRKTTDSAVTGTTLRLMLHNMGIDSVIVTGVFTDQCVSGTVRSLADESFNVWLIEDACRAATEEIQNHELAVLNNIYCHVINTKELLTAIN